jgi:hypothetical protein
MQGETVGAQGFANAAVIQASEDDLAEQALGAFANLATSTDVDRSVVAHLTEANSSLAKQLEDNATSLKEVKALLKKERAERASGGNSGHPLSAPSHPPRIIIAGHMVTKWHLPTQSKLVCTQMRVINGNQQRPTIWEGPKSTRINF